MVRAAAGTGGQGAGASPSAGPGAGDATRDGLAVHGSVVAVTADADAPAPPVPRAVLITGRSGAGKSALALSLMALGARLVADDHALLYRSAEGLIARCPAPLMGMIEARGVGLLRASALPDAALVLMVDLDSIETERLPHPRSRTIAGVALPCLHKVDQPYFPAAILQYLKGGRIETQ